MFNNQELKEFLHEAGSATYASGDESRNISEPDGSTTITYKKDDWMYHDNYFGGEPYGGREVVFYKGKAVFMMVYYGWVNEEVKNISEVYAFLQEALRQSTVEAPFRGLVGEYTNGEFRYVNTLTADVERFSGEETIYKNEKEVYKAGYMGGYVDQR